MCNSRYEIDIQDKKGETFGMSFLEVLVILFESYLPYCSLPEKINPLFCHKKRIQFSHDSSIVTQCLHN